jgi:hypothetical protein
MRLLLKLAFYAAAIAALWWLLPQIAASLNRATEAASTADASQGYALFAVYLIIGTALGLFVAWDVSRLLGELAGSLFVGGGKLPSLTPVLWKADRLREQGEPLKAVNTLRAHLQAHPRQWYIAVRIAELYQHALEDPLSAALEYEALLQQRLPRSARAKILLRLAACQLLLRKGDQSAATLRELIANFPQSNAAEKARRRLARMNDASADSADR